MIPRGAIARSQCKRILDCIRSCQIGFQTSQLTSLTVEECSHYSISLPALDTIWLLNFANLICVFRVISYGLNWRFHDSMEIHKNGIFVCVLAIWIPFMNCCLRASLVAQNSKESACNARDPGSIPGWGRYPGEGNGNPLQYSCLENSMDRGT